MASKCSSGRKSYRSLTLNKILEIIKLSEGGMSKAQKNQRLGFLCQTLSQECKKKFLNEIKSTTPANA